MDFQDYVAAIGSARRGAAPAGAAALPGPDNVVLLATTVSTSDVARGVAVDFESEGLDLDATLVLTLEQTGGRGRHGRSWASPAGRGVYATLARVYRDVGQLPALPLLVGVGLCRALAPWLPAGCRLKWPNDLVVPRGPGGAAATIRAATSAGAAASSDTAASAEAATSGGAAASSDTAASAEAATSGGAAASSDTAASAEAATSGGAAASSDTAASAEAATSGGAAASTGAAASSGAAAWAKIGGVLIEALVRPSSPAVALIGFGVNHSHRAADLPPGATSVWLEAAAGAAASGGAEASGGDATSDRAASSGEAGPFGEQAAAALPAAGEVDLPDLAELTWALVAGVENELAHAGDMAYAVAAYRELSVHRPGDRLVCSVGADRKVAGRFGGFDDSGRLRLLDAVEVGAGGEAPGAAGEPGKEMLLAAGEVIAE